MNTTLPTVSVLVTVFNRERIIGDAVRSVLSQTFSDLELIVVDDGSTDRSAEVVRTIRDPRINLVRHQTNQGIPGARNTALAEARGRFIAWLDSDDLCRPHRLAEQLRFLSERPEIALVGSCAGKIDHAGKPMGGIRIPPFDHDEIRAWQLFRSPFQQSSLLGRAEVLRAYPYRNEFAVCEDVDALVRIACNHRVANLARTLIDRRIHEQQTVSTQQEQISSMKGRIVEPQLSALGVKADPVDIGRHVHLGMIKSVPGVPADVYLDWAETWLKTLVAANRRSKLFGRDALNFTVAQVWTKACRRAAREIGSAAAARLFITSPLSLKLVGRDGLRRMRDIAALPFRQRLGG